MPEPDYPDTEPLRLRDLFAGQRHLAPLLTSAHVFDRTSEFVEAARSWAPEIGSELQRALVSAIGREARRTEALADSTKVGWRPHLPDEEEARRTVLGGQQAYIDYTPGVLAKLDALDRVNAAGSELLGWYGLIEYDAFGSDRLISRTELPRAEPLGDRLPLLTLQIHPGAKRWRQHDMRRVPPPEAAWLGKQIEALGAQLAYVGRRLPDFDRRRAFERLKLLADDYEHARCRARHVGDFNVIWSVRQFRRLGFRAPCLRLGELMNDPTLRPALAGILECLVRREPEIEDSIRQAVERARRFDLLMQPERARPFPLRFTEASTGLRLALYSEKRGPDLWLLSRGGRESFEKNLGPASADELCELLREHGDALGFDVFLPLFLFRLGLAGLINGRGSMRYSLVLGHLLECLFGHPHPPNLLAAGRSPASSPRAQSPLVEAIRERRDDLPPELAALDTTLVAALLFMEPDRIRRWVGRVWHGGSEANP